MESFDALHLIPTIRSTHPACVDSERDSTVTEYELIDALGTYSSGMQSWTAMYFIDHDADHSNKRSLHAVGVQ